MTSAASWCKFLLGMGFGIAAMFGLSSFPRTVEARPNDRFEDYVMCTGACAVNPRSLTDGVWLLDYRTGRLLGTVIDRNAGRIVGWAEVDLSNEFGLPPKSNAHFMMTTGNIAQGQAALYVAEISSGKFGVYSLGPDVNAQMGVSIRRHDITSFRKTERSPG